MADRAATLLMRIAAESVIIAYVIGLEARWALRRFTAQRSPAG